MRLLYRGKPLRIVLEDTDFDSLEDLEEFDNSRNFYSKEVLVTKKAYEKYRTLIDRPEED